MMHHHLRVSPNDHQHVVEVMRDSSGQPAHGLHLLRLAHLVFQAPARGHVPRGNDNSTHRGVVQQIVGEGFEPDPRSVFMTKTEFRRHRGSRLQRDSFQTSPHRREVIGMNEVKQAVADKF